MEKLTPGSTIGGIFLVAGCSIGAGMLGLPVLLGLTGFNVSIILTLFAWGFMTFTGLLLVEINGWFYERTNLISMAKKSFGAPGQVLVWILYLFLFYSLLVAYTAGSGKIVSSFLSYVISDNLASVIFVLFFSVFVYAGMKVVDVSNRILMVGLIISYLLMIFLGLSKVNFSYFKYVNLKYFLLPIAVLIPSFGFHNIVPSLVSYMKGDLQRTKKAIIGGTLITLVVYFLWMFFILGVIPVKGPNGLYRAYVLGNEATIPLKNILYSKPVVLFAALFAFFSIVTSFLTQSIGLMHFIADGIKVRLSYKNNIWLLLLTVLPPLGLSISFPNIFYQALSFAGSYCAVILFGILPALMVWKGRYIKKETTNYQVTGGKFSLILVLIFSIGIILSKLLS